MNIIFDQAILFCTDHLRVCAEHPFGDSLALVGSDIPCVVITVALERSQKEWPKGHRRVVHFVLIVILYREMTDFYHLETPRRDSLGSAASIWESPLKSYC